MKVLTSWLPVCKEMGTVYVQVHYLKFSCAWAKAQWGLSHLCWFGILMTYHSERRGAVGQGVTGDWALQCGFGVKVSLCFGHRTMCLLGPAQQCVHTQCSLWKCIFSGLFRFIQILLMSDFLFWSLSDTFFNQLLHLNVQRDYSFIPIVGMQLMIFFITNQSSDCCLC